MKVLYSRIKDTLSKSLSCLWTVWPRGCCRISPPRFLAECCKRQLNQVVLFCCILRCLLFLICIEFVFSCTVLFVSISQAIGYEDRLRNDLYCVRWGVKLYSNQTMCTVPITFIAVFAAYCDTLQ